MEKVMSEEKSQTAQMKPYLIAAAALVTILVVVMLWPAADEPAPDDLTLTPSTEVAPIEVPTETVVEESEPEIFEPPQRPTPVVIGEEAEAPKALEPVVEVAQDLPLDVSDLAIKAAVIEAIRSPQMSRLLVNEGLLQKFVINVNNLANQEITLKDNLLVPPSQSFSVYNQADRVWIDRSSFQRYNPYVDAIETVSADDLLEVYQTYKPTLIEKFTEIARPGDELDDTLMRAIDELLDTPQVPVPIEVYSESVMFKFADPKIEALSEPQKQMIRMGPDNMRRLKEVLRELKTELEAKQ
jgi:hypothetical protein